MTLGVYAILFWVAETTLGTKALTLALLPVMGGSWYLGLRGGFLSTTLTFMLSVLLFETKGYSNSWTALIHEGLPGTLSLYIVSAILGYLGHRERQCKEAVNIRAHVAKIFEAQVSSLMNLVSITNEVLDADNFLAVLQVLAEKTREMFNANDCLISLWDQETQIYYSKAAAGKEQPALEKIPPHAENDVLARLQMADILIYGKLEELGDVGKPFVTIHPQGTLLALPLIASGEKIGILNLLYEYDHQFTADELTYAKLTSRQVSQAILKVILLSRAEEQVDELSILHQIAVVISQVKDEDTLLEHTVNVLGVSLFPANLTIVLLNEQLHVLERNATYHLNENDTFEFIPLGQGVTGSVAKTGTAERYDDVRQIPHYISALSSSLSELCVPIKVGDKILGVINVESDELAAFDIQDERILTTVANQIAVGLTRLRAEQAQTERVTEIARANDLIHALTEVASQMETSSDPGNVMHQIGLALEKLELKILIALFESDSQDLVIRYTSLDSTVVKKLERFSGKTSMVDFRISLDSLPAYISLTENLHPVILKDYISVISRILQGFTNDALRKILEGSVNLEKMTLGHFPLVYREKVLGFLWLWGDRLTEPDLPTLSVFANQVAATLENARLFADVQRLAITDGLTNLFTRRHFFAMAYEEFYRARRYGRPLSIIMLDLDYFKKVNDTYGHAAGDMALAEAAAICKNALRANDIIGRYGGEEIVILLVETELQFAKKVALRIWQKIRELQVSTQKGNIHITISGGVAGDDVEAMNLIEMIEAADKAMYAAKNAGRDQIMIAPLPQPQKK